MLRSHFVSLRVRLLLLLLFAILPAFGLLFLTGFDQRRHAASAVKEEALQLARLASADQAESIREAHQLLFALAQLPVVGDGDRGACSAFFANLNEQYPHYTNFGVVDLDGNVVCSGQPLADPVNFADRAWFQRVIETGDFVVGEYVIGRITGKALITLAYPVVDAEGRVQRVLFTGLDLAWINELAAQVQLPPGSTLTVLDRSGTILARHPDPERWDGRSVPETSLFQTIEAQQGGGTAEIPGVDGALRLFAFTPLGDTAGSVFVSVGIPASVAFAEADRTLIRNLVGLGLIAVLALAVAWLGGDVFFLRRVKALVGATERLAAGDLSARAGMRDNPSELGQLASAFDQMAGQLEQREVERRRAEEALQRSAAEIRNLQLITEALLELEELPRIMQILAEGIVTHLGYDVAVIFRYVEAQHAFTGLAFHPMPAAGQLDPILTLIGHPGLKEKLHEYQVPYCPGANPIVDRVLAGESIVSDSLADFVEPWIPRFAADAVQTFAGMQSYIDLPVQVREKTVGTILAGVRKGPITAGRQRALARVADQAAIAIENARLYAETQRRAAHLEALNAIIATASAATDLPGLLETVLGQSLQALGLEMGAIWAVGGRATRGLPPEVIHASAEVARAWLDIPGPIAIEDWEQIGEDEPWSVLAPDMARLGVRASLIVTTAVEGQRIEGMSLACPEPRRWLPEEIALVQAVGQQLGGAAERVSMLQRAQDRAERMARLAGITETLSRPLEPGEVLGSIGEGAVALGGADRAAIYVRNSDDSLTCPWSRGLSSAYVRQVTGHPRELPGGRLFDQPNPVLVPDVERLPEESPLRHLARVEGYRAVGLWPLVYEGRVIAAVACYYDAPRTWPEVEQEVMETFCRQTAVTLENARLFAETRRWLKQLRALREIDTAITASVDLRVTLNVLVGQVTAQLGTDAADVLLLNQHTQTLEYAAGHGFRTDAIMRSRLRLGEGYAGRVALERRTLSIPNLAKTEDFVRTALLASEGFIAYSGVPLIAKGQVKGVLEIFHRTARAPDPEWLTFAETLAGQAAIAIDNATLFEDLQRSNVALTLAYDTTLEGWARALELRDMETGGHTRRVTEMTLYLARTMGMSEKELVHVRRGVLLHDIGKMGIPDKILLKPSELTVEEREIIQHHPVYAYEMLSPIAYLRPALDIPYCHHEKWDGTGYPRGLKGEEIPLAARIFAVVDVYDALRSDRPYRDAWPEEEVMEYIREQAGMHFDPQVVEAFMQLETVRTRGYDPTEEG